MFKAFSKVAIVLLIMVALIGTTPFIGYLIDGAPERLAPAVVAYALLLVSYFIWRNAKRLSRWPIIHLAMTLNFLSLIMICWSWIGVPFVDAIFIIIGNGSLVFLMVSLILGLVSSVILRKSGPNHASGAGGMKIRASREDRAKLT